jgi:cyclic pyranopterin phosphate synthase
MHVGHGVAWGNRFHGREPTGPGTLRDVQREPLRDGHGRLISDLRVSVTDRCNFRCQYCMPAEGIPWLDRAEILSFEEIERLVALLATMGVRDVRLTGGEPLVRRAFPTLVAKLALIEGVEDLSLTTNGYLLERDADALVAAGITRVNVSIDSLQRDRFFQITRRDSLPQVLRGLEAIARHPRVRPIKVNAVAMRGFTEEEALPFAEFARSSSFQVRFIEFMPLDADHAWTRDAVLTGEELRQIIDRVYPLEEKPREPSATARVFRFRDLHGEIGFINPVSEPFCADCNRIRLTAEGKLRTCLFSLHETDLRGPLRDGAADDELERIVRDAVWRKELKHNVGEPGFRQPPRTMSAIGG